MDKYRPKSGAEKHKERQKKLEDINMAGRLLESGPPAWGCANYGIFIELCRPVVVSSETGLEIETSSRSVNLLMSVQAPELATSCSGALRSSPTSLVMHRASIRGQTDSQSSQVIKVRTVGSVGSSYHMSLHYRYFLPPPSPPPPPPPSISLYSYLCLPYVPFRAGLGDATESQKHLHMSWALVRTVKYSRHHRIRSMIAEQFRSISFQVFEEVYGLADNGSTRRIDMIAIPPNNNNGYIIDPTVRFEKQKSQ
ncbi:hypothetical protein ANN_08809 [Periplaneta americana]|uniref:Uncharacterized protein n=1 Tax=Periplaneta americana TaxID=6978 RepID=A0ABQ8T465_PERAM|nr:hypothetical protein ANN_08809 [Periplaneta americana]